MNARLNTPSTQGKPLSSGGLGSYVSQPDMALVYVTTYLYLTNGVFHTVLVVVPLPILLVVVLRMTILYHSILHTNLYLSLIHI